MTVTNMIEINFYDETSMVVYMILIPIYPWGKILMIIQPSAENQKKLRFVCETECKKEIFRIG